MLLLDEPSFHPATIEHMLGAIQEAEAALEPPSPAAWPASDPPPPRPRPALSTQPPPGRLLTLDQISCRWPKARAGPGHTATAIAPATKIPVSPPH
jgi:hypothetical protein